MMSSTFSDPEATARKGERIYDQKYRAQYENTAKGQFLAIEVNSENAYLGANPEEAITNGKRAVPNGIFHLVRIGSVGAFRVSYTSNETHNRSSSQ
jgi:hypothetical protein